MQSVMHLLHTFPKRESNPRTSNIIFIMLNLFRWILHRLNHQKKAFKDICLKAPNFSKNDYLRLFVLFLDWTLNHPHQQRSVTLQYPYAQVPNTTMTAKSPPPQKISKSILCAFLSGRADLLNSRGCGPFPIFSQETDKEDKLQQL